MTSLNRFPTVAFLPCRSGSERVKAKNVRPFSNIEGGLTQIKVQQLLNCPEIDSIVVSTDDSQVADICRKASHGSSKQLIVFDRPPHLAASSTSTDDLICYVSEIITEGVILWTHVTSPFIDESVYADAIKTYRSQSNLNGYDSLMTVTKLQKFIWNKEGPINYKRAQEKWPRTQTLNPLYEVNSAMFMAPAEVYLQQQDRIGKKVYLYDLTPSQAMDIDWEEDFVLAEKRWHLEH